MNDYFTLSATCPIKLTGKKTQGIKRAIRSLKKDMHKIFGDQPETKSSCEVVVENLDLGLNRENFNVTLSDDRSLLRIVGENELGTIFGIYHVCEELLGVDPFEYWTGCRPSPKSRIRLCHYHYESPEPRMRFRGWFINGEDSLIGMGKGIRIPLKLYERIYETLLRTRNNMVCPATWVPGDSLAAKLASEMGLWLAHHHCEPLGAPFFNKIYPCLTPDMYKESKRYEEIYRKTIEYYERNNFKVVYTLGVRGQADGPFWRELDGYDTDEARRQYILDGLKFQLETVECVTGRNDHHFVFQLYLENLLLFKDRLDEIPEKVILAWGDNGYGAMRIRMGGKNVSPVPDFDPHAGDIISLPDGNLKRPQGVYYHVNYHDLRASNQLTMLVAPKLIISEYLKMGKLGIKDFSLLNVGNIRPHVYELDLLSKYLSGRINAPNPSQVVKEHAVQFFDRRFPDAPEKVASIYHDYFTIPFQFNPKYADQVVGDEFYHYFARLLVYATLDVPNSTPKATFFHKEMNFWEQAGWVGEQCLEASEKWKKLLKRCEIVEAKLEGDNKRFFKENIHLQTIICGFSCEGLLRAISASEYYREGKFQKAFVHAHLACEAIRKVVNEMSEAEQGRWKGFYKYEFLTGVRQTLWRLEILRNMSRLQGEGSTPYMGWSRKVNPFSKNKDAFALAERVSIADSATLAQALIDNTVDLLDDKQ